MTTSLGVRTIPILSVPADPITKVVLVRHGEAKCNVDGVVGGRRGCRGLTETGVRQAELLRDRLVGTGELLAAGAFYASTLPRAVETATVIAPAVGDGGLEMIVDDDLCELVPGDADGLTWDQYEARYDEPDWDIDPEAPIAPGGESWSGFVRRVRAALVGLTDRHPGQLVVVVSHAGLIEACMLAFLVSGGPNRLGLHTHHASLTEWHRAAGGQWRLARYNDASHLATGGRA